MISDVAKANANKWDRRFLDLAQHIASWSKDPSTKVGAVIVDVDKRVVSVGFNGLARGVVDLPERLDDREMKYKMIIHAERNALLFARGNLKGTVLYCSAMLPCTACAALIIQAGVARVVAVPPSPELFERWGPDINLSTRMFIEAGVDFNAELI
jgi:dCMP deaminase